MTDSADVSLHLKKRARRRLVGAVAFAGLAAVVLPMVMDEEPKQQIQEVQIRIPGQDSVPPMGQVSKPPVAPALNDKAAITSPEAKPAAVVQAPAKAPEGAVVAPRPVETRTEKPGEKSTPDRSAEKLPEKIPEKAPKAPVAEGQRAASILEGKPAASAPQPVAGAGGEFVILIGAFSNPANVKQLQSKIGELGIRVYTEPLDSPGGPKTRVRAGPFASREAADKALDKMKRIGVDGKIATR